MNNMQQQQPWTSKNSSAKRSFNKDRDDTKNYFK